jgi:hypothetical protein
LEKKYDIVIEANKGTVSKRGWRLGGKRLLTATAILGTKAVEVEDGTPEMACPDRGSDPARRPLLRIA